LTKVQDVNNELQRIVAEAQDLAARGLVSSGYSLLHAGLLRAMADREIGQSWAEEVICGYYQAMDRYAVDNRLRSRGDPR
jgi:hypothetical protein